MCHHGNHPSDVSYSCLTLTTIFQHQLNTIMTHSTVYIGYIKSECMMTSGYGMLLLWNPLFDDCFACWAGWKLTANKITSIIVVQVQYVLMAINQLRTVCHCRVRMDFPWFIRDSRRGDYVYRRFLFYSGLHPWLSVSKSSSFGACACSSVHLTQTVFWSWQWHDRFGYCLCSCHVGKWYRSKLPQHRDTVISS